MAEEKKKKTTTRKKTAAKRVSKKTTDTKPKAKKATTAESKISATAKSHSVKKATTPKKIVTKAKIASEPATKTNTLFSWNDWQSVLGQSFTAWKAIFWRYAGVLCLALFMQILGVFAATRLGVLLLGGKDALENIMANLMVGTITDPKIVWITLAVFVGWLVYTVIIGAMSKIAFLSVVRDYVENKSSNVFDSFFKEGWQRLGAYLWLGIKLFFYVCWPLFVGLILSIVMLALGGDSLVTKSKEWGIYTCLTVGFLGMLYFAIKALFAMPMLIHTRKSAKQSFAQTKSLMQKKWGYVALMWGLFVLALYGLNMIFSWVSLYDPIVLVDAIEPANRLGLTDLLAFLFGLFMLAPIATAFQYFLMLKTAQNKGVKL